MLYSSALVAVVRGFGSSGIISIAWMRKHAYDGASNFCIGVCRYCSDGESGEFGLGFGSNKFCLAHPVTQGWI